jgi:16S rRNA pseudouridine516 synthase
MAAQRIDKLLSGTGRYSRREAAALAKSGAVTVDGVCCRDASKKVDPEKQTVAVRGEPLGWKKHVYLLMNKPLGVLSATKDREQKTVLDLLPAEYRARKVFPVGRLDKDTSGLLLLTDDGDFSHRLTSPKHRVDKVYLAQTDGTPEEAAVQRFADGLTLRDGTKCLPAKLEILGENQVRVTVQEGQYHQVRRMLAACGTPVVALMRLREGGLELDSDLKPGEWRELTEAEIRLFS